ncbi:MAG: putative lipase [Propionibacteriaceae bacterium]|jgi:hypothetical protein|nr:putative lipase [Propionibacteriaceae bacterium]
MIRYSAGRRAAGFAAAIALGLSGTLGASTAPSAAAHTRPPSTGSAYVAMGDSYSSGEGTMVYESAAHPCHRSPLAYGPLLARRDKDLRPIRFVACSGASTTDLPNRNHRNRSEPAQFDALSPATRTVTLTIGGNDLGFSQVAFACVKSLVNVGYGCSKNPLITVPVAIRRAALAGRGEAPAADGSEIVDIPTILAGIHQRAPKAKIYLVGYPDLFGSRRSDFSVDPIAPSGYACRLNDAAQASIDFDDAQWFNRSTHLLNRVYKESARHARAAGIPANYVRPSTFAGHGLCDAKKSWINPVLLDGFTPRSETFHPTQVGQRRGYARAVHRAID